MSKLLRDVASLVRDHLFCSSLLSSHQPVCVDKGLMGIDVDMSRSSLLSSALTPPHHFTVGLSRVIRIYSEALIDRRWGRQGLDSHSLVGLGLLGSSGVTDSFFLSSQRWDPHLLSNTVGLPIFVIVLAR